MTLSPDVLEVMTRLAIATALGGAVGVNRELRQKPAGFRTHALLALGAALLTVIALNLTGNQTVADADAVSRVMQGIVVGIGFVGGGAILRQDTKANVHALTTATSIWVVAAVGIASGLGMWPAALTSVALALLVLTVGSRIDSALHRLRPSGDEDE